MAARQPRNTKVADSFIWAPKLSREIIAKPASPVPDPKMQRQKSILSFLKPQNSGGGKDVSGAGTSLEKMPRQGLAEDGGIVATPSVFSSIKHKFVRSEGGMTASTDCRFKGDETSIIQYLTDKYRGQEDIGNGYLGPKHLNKHNEFNASKTISSNGKKWCSSETIREDIIVPDKSGTRPVVPGLKRVQESLFNCKENADVPASSCNKKQKILMTTDIGTKDHNDDFKLISKFEWLHPSQIKDANGRNIGDPLYDKRTLYIPPDALSRMSASQRQYWNVKCQYMDTVLFFKVGKFYELYELDAEIGHKELDWKMTLSGVGKCRQVGISESGIDGAVQKLIAHGHNVGRMEQIETSDQAKSRGTTSVIQRKLVRVISPATNDDNIGPDAVHLLAIKENGSTGFGFAFVDCAALKFWVGSISDDISCAALGALLVQVSPKEIIYEKRGLSNEAQRTLEKYSVTGLSASQLTPADAFCEAMEVKNSIVSNRYFSGSCDSWHSVLDGVAQHNLALCALGGLINHLARLMLNDVIRNGDISSYEVYGGCLRMDGQTLVNLEIFSNNADGSNSGTLYKYLNNCITSSGKRLLRNWICHPLKDVEKINYRLDVVEDLIANSEVVLQISQSLRKLPDLERLLGCIKSGIQSSALLLLPLIGSKILKKRVRVFGLLIKGLRAGMDMLMAIQDQGHVTSLSKVVALPMLRGSEGLDKFLVQFEGAIDSDFPNYQNHDVRDSEAETLAILMELFIEKVAQWSQVIHAINNIDVLRSFAVAAINSAGVMCRPVLFPQSKFLNPAIEVMHPLLETKGLWHPYALGENGGLPVPNNIHLGGNGRVPCTMLLTGPNMGGKSTLLRATCLAVILAQLGFFVPCEMCALSVVDIIFTRLGATDRIMTGESTFLIECTETASVLQNASQDSLVVLDELGRGTSTFDGYSIAYAVFRQLVETVHCRLLFATHYHALTKEFSGHPLVTLQHMACSFSSNKKNELVFLYRLTSGACPESYGMQVALMAGISEQVVESATKAAQIMKKKIGKSFELCEKRGNFSTLHEEWVKSLLCMSNTKEINSDDDTFDALICLWHEVKSSYKVLT
ncbi:LOW QUALITY PROTEIN: DNA mismatch repair protein MSH7 [Primulina tabacum]|uniref:LOW QUALITY PROTEIN: DNA mismatch repair protein MSH7 n=1 Tax=Primulina tabacum TaxID=48773 RepID=UPI003F59A365